MTPDLPIEFVVRGVAVSLQGSARSRNAWKQAVRAAGAAAVLPGSWALMGRVSVTIYYFPEGQMFGDIDNIVKPILDAMVRFIYVDDRQIERVVVQKFESDHKYEFSKPSPSLAMALDAGESVLYVKVTDGPHEDLQ